MMKAKNILGTLLLSIILIGCEQSISLDLPEYVSKISVECIVQPDREPNLFITRSQERLGYVDGLDTIPQITDALVTLTSDAGDHSCIYAQPFNYDASYYDCSLEVPSSGFLSLRIEHEGDVVTAETRIPTKASIKSLDSDIIIESFYDFEIRRVLISAKIDDVPNEENYYRLAYTVRPNGDAPLVTSPLKEGETFFSDANQEGAELTISESIPFFNSWENEDAIYIDVFVQSLSESAFDFLSTSILQENTGDVEEAPFIEPVPINGNIENGLGVFGAFVNSEPLRLSFIP